MSSKGLLENKGAILEPRKAKYPLVELGEIFSAVNPYKESDGGSYRQTNAKGLRKLLELPEHENSVSDFYRFLKEKNGIKDVKEVSQDEIKRISGRDLIEYRGLDNIVYISDDLTNAQKIAAAAHAYGHGPGTNNDEQMAQLNAKYLLQESGQFEALSELYSMDKRLKKAGIVEKPM